MFPHYYLTEVAPWRCLIFERIYGSMDPLLLTADPLPYHLSPYHAFSKNGCVFFPMDIRIFGSLTTNACRVGGSLEVSIFERIRGSVDSLLSTEDPLPYHLRPYHTHVTLLWWDPWRVLFLSGWMDDRMSCYYQDIYYLTKRNITLHFSKSGLCIFFNG